MRPGARATRWSTARCSAGCSPTSTASCGSSGCRAGSTTCGRRWPAWPRPTDRARGPWSCTPGIGHPSYFEHTYLASHLGYHLVEGPDLAVRGGRVWLRALAGLEPVDVVLRRVEDGDADPLELGDPGPGGVPGLVQASREGGLGVANALGSGLAGDVALQAYLPAACEALLDERLLLASPRTLWLGDATQRAEALSDLPTDGAPRARPDGVTVGVRGPAGGVRAGRPARGRSNSTRAATWPRPVSSWPPRR